nr:nucleolar protein 14 [Cryptococcus depauperatus CBS 7855]
MAPSQLSQLKSALSNAGISRKTYSKKEKKAYKKGGARETDRQKKFDKLEEIRKSLNKFDERETKVKHDAGGRNLKGVVGRPSASRQAGLEQRKKSLLLEHQLKDHRGTFRDRRFGENDPSLSLEDRMLERYTRERQRGQGKKGMFNLEDNEEPFGEFDDGFALGDLTHGGRNVMDLPGDDFDAQGFGEKDDEKEDKGRIDNHVVSQVHFGGFNKVSEDEGLPVKKKSKHEVMAEVIAKSKEHKFERQMQKEADAELRDQLDDRLADLQALLAGSTALAPTDTLFPTTSKPRVASPSAVDAKAIEDGEYDQIVRSLAFDARAKPKNRTKSEEELAKEEKDKLELAEAKRLRRMMGKDVSDEQQDDGSRKRRRIEGKKPGADDLEDDYFEDETFLGPGLTREEIEDTRLLGSEVDSNSKEESENEDDDKEEQESNSDLERMGEEEDSESDEDSMRDENEEEETLLDGVEPIFKKPEKNTDNTSKVNEIPFTFPCPSTIDQFENILDPLEEDALPIVVQRIRTLHHPSLGEGNKEKLLHFFGVLLDYILVLSSRSNPPFPLMQNLIPHLTALIQLNPVSAASHFVEKLALMQKNLTRGLARGAAKLESKTLPAAPELALLRFIGVFWSTSDLSHPVVAPAVLLMGQYLSQARVRSLRDLASGLLLCSLLVEYEAFSKRLIPEAITFVASAFTILLPRRKNVKPVEVFPDLKAPSISLFLTLPSTAIPSHPIDITSALKPDENLEKAQLEQRKMDLLIVALKLVDTFAHMYANLEAFVEVMTPFKKVLEESKIAKLSEESKAIFIQTFSSIAKRITNTLSVRQPLTLQSHKPIPIVSYAPRFEENYTPGRHYDPDAERNASAKLKALYKKEKKGAMRELRKDNKFLAGEKAREQAEKDKEYAAKLRKAEGSITVERAEEKAMQSYSSQREGKGKEESWKELAA